MTITNSTDISIFDFNPQWDISGVIPVLRIFNVSAGDNLSNVAYWFVATAGGSIAFHTGTAAAPDVTGLWDTLPIAEPIPQTLGHIDWSGSDFSVTGFARDLAGQVFSFTKVAHICRPSGNGKTGTTGNFGVGNVDMTVMCDKARIYVEDNTDYTYAGLTGINIYKQIKLIYPPDATGTPPDPKVVLDSNSALIPISINGDGYVLILASFYAYTFPDGSSVKIQFKFQKAFAVQCNVDLCPLICDIERLEQRYEKYGCDTDERSRLALINSKLNRALMAKMQPLCGVDVAALVDEIKALGGFTCDCSCNDFGINAMSVGIDGSGVTCPDVIGCINDLLNTLDPTCLATQAEWEGMSLAAKFQLMISSYCCAPIAAIQGA